MTSITPTELQLLKTRPHTTNLYLSIYQPETVFATTLNNGAAAKGNTYLPTSSGTSYWDYLNVEPDFTLMVGTSAGEDDKGRIRVKDITGAGITVPVNSSINWSNGDHLTVLRYTEIWPKYPRIIQSPDDATQTLWYKDGDIEYSNQNSTLGTFICMGGNYAGFLENGSCDVYYSASGTYNLLEEGLTYHWFFQGADTTGSSSQEPGYISYSTPGQYMTRLTVSGSSSADVSYRYVSIYDHPSDGTDVPILNWEIKNLSGNRDSGGYTATVQIRESTAFSIVKDGALVVIFAEDWYGDTKQSIGGNAINRQSIVFSGYIIDGTIQYNYRDGYVEFDIGSPTELMSRSEGFGIDVTSSTDPAGQSASDPNYPSGWVLLLNMDVRRAIFHYLKWHSTVLTCVDFNVIRFGTDRDIRHFSADRSSLYDAINTLMESALVGKICSDRQGRLYAEIEIKGLDLAPDIFPSIYDLDKTTWMGDPHIEEVQTPNLSWLEMGGLVYSGPTDDESTPMIAAAPGVEPGFRGKMEQLQGLALGSQGQLNALVGNVYAYRNSRYPSSEYSLVGNFRNFDIAPQEVVSITLEATDTPRGITFSGKKFAVRSLTFNYDARSKFMYPMMEVAEVTTGFDGDTVIIPETPPTTGGGGGGGNFVFPPITIPPIPVYVPCQLDDAAPPNGPYYFPFSETIYSYDASPFVTATLPSIIRRGSASFRTTVVINGCKYYSTDGGATWYPALDFNGVTIRGLSSGEPAGPTATNNPFSGGSECSERSGIFSPASPYATDGYTVGIQSSPLYAGSGVSGIELISVGPESYAEQVGELGVTADGADVPTECWSPAANNEYSAAIYRIDFDQDIDEGSIFIEVTCNWANGTGPTVTGTAVSFSDPTNVPIISNPPACDFDGDPLYTPVLTAGTSPQFVNVGETIKLTASAVVESPTAGSSYYFCLYFQSVKYSAGPPKTRAFGVDIVAVGWSPTVGDDIYFMFNRTERLDVNNVIVYNVCFD